MHNATSYLTSEEVKGEIFKSLQKYKEELADLSLAQEMEKLGHEDLRKLLEEEDNEMFSFPCSVILNHQVLPSSATWLLTNGFCNYQDGFGETPLFDACRRNDLALVRRLLNIGANPLSLAKETGVSPFLAALVLKNHETLLLLSNHIGLNESVVMSHLFDTGYEYEEEMLSWWAYWQTCLLDSEIADDKEGRKARRL